MDKKDYLKIAQEYSINLWNFDIVRYAGEEDGWHYFSCTREGRPRYSSLPLAIRVNNSSGGVEEINGNDRLTVNAMAYRLSLKSNN